MIKSVSAKGFKGLEFHQELYPKTIFCGENGSGKSARSMAITLAIMGYIPGYDKTGNPAILAAFGKEKMMVGVSLNATVLNRQWAMNAKTGAVSQTYLVDTRKSTKAAYDSSLGKAGDPKIFDLSIFMGLSDQKKIDYLFELFPPTGDVNKLDGEITDLKDKLNYNREYIRSTEGFIKKTMESRAAMELPSGTLAEVSNELKEIKEKLNKAWKDLEAAKIAKAEAEATAKAEAEAKEAADEKERLQAADESWGRSVVIGNPEYKDDQESKNQEARQALENMTDKVKIGGDSWGENVSASSVFDLKLEVVKSIGKIIQAIIDVDCDVCINGAAIMIAKKELKKYI